MSKYHQGKYKVKNQQKYIGDVDNVIYRSSWELKFLCWCDKTDNIVAFSSEEVVIPYKSPVDGKFHRYFVDFYVKYKTKDDIIKVMLVEIKPYKQTIEPVKKNRVTKQYITEVVTYGINQAKWKYAEEYCKDRGWEFKVLTEKDLGITIL